MRKRKFVCHKCNKTFKGAIDSANHFQKYPDHRNKKQQQSYEQNQSYRKKQGRKRTSVYGSPLPTIKSTTRTRTDRVARFCTQCGVRRMPAHVYCGGCGEKL